MHREDIEKAKAELDRTWVPWEKRFGGEFAVEPVRNINPKVHKAVAPEPVEQKEPITLGIIRKTQAFNESRKVAAQAAQVTDPCDKTGENHRWNRHGAKLEGGAVRKRCRDCGHVRALTPADDIKMSVARDGKTIQHKTAAAISMAFTFLMLWGIAQDPGPLSSSRHGGVKIARRLA